MALARCINCGCPNGKGGNAYSARSHVAVGFPDSGIVCGTKGCLSAAHIWLLMQEEAEYGRGERVFPLTGCHAGTKFRVQ